MKAEHLPFADSEFDVATAIEVLEHVPDPAHTVAEMARVAERWLLVSVPREPLWRGLNMARGAYVKDLGNTPGHVNHWSKRSFVSLLEPPRRGRRGALAVPVDDAARPALSARAGDSAPRPATAAAPASSRSGSRSTGRGHVRVLLGRLLRPRRRRLQADLAAVVGAVHHRLGDLPADRAAALAHDRRPPRARLRARPPAAHAADPAGGLRARVPRARARAARADPGRPVRRLRDAVLDPRRRGARLRGELLRARLARRPPVVRALRRARVPRGDRRGWSSRSRSRSGSRRGQTAVALGMAAAPFVSLVVVPWAFSRRPPAHGRARPTRTTLGLRARRALRARGAGGDDRRADAAQRRRPARRRRPRRTRRSPASCSTCC